MRSQLPLLLAVLAIYASAFAVSRLPDPFTRPAEPFGPDHRPMPPQVKADWERSHSLEGEAMAAESEGDWGWAAAAYRAETPCAILSLGRRGPR